MVPLGETWSETAEPAAALAAASSLGNRCTAVNGNGPFVIDS